MRMAIAYPEVTWVYVSDDEELLDLKPKLADGRLKDLFGVRQVESLVRVHESGDYLTIDGYIGRPDFARKSRAEQFLFINRRFVVNRAINHAVFQAYEHLLDKGTFPFFILNLTLDPRKVDVNVHPSKMEVKFENESVIYRFVLSSIRRALASNDVIPALSMEADETSGRTDERLRFNQPQPVSVGAAPPEAEPVGRTAPLTFPPGEGLDQVDLEKLFGKIERRLGTETLRKDGEATFPADLQRLTPPSSDRLLQHRPMRGPGEKEPVQ
jgi:hypothetical protein